MLHIHHLIISSSHHLIISSLIYYHFLYYTLVHYYYYCIHLSFNPIFREQKTLDLENHARYRALHDRWVVLDKTISLPDEEPSSDPLEYLFSSEGEEEDEEARGKYKYQYTVFVHTCIYKYSVKTQEQVLS